MKKNVIRPKKETLELYRQALDVEWLNKEETFQYFVALMRAKRWGEKIDRENQEYRRKHHFNNI